MLVFYGYNGKEIKDKSDFPYAPVFYKEGYGGDCKFRSFVESLDWDKQKEYCRVGCDGMYVFIEAVGMYVHVESLSEAWKYVTRVKENIAKEKE